MFSYIKSSPRAPGYSIPLLSLIVSLNVVSAAQQMFVFMFKSHLKTEINSTPVMPFNVRASLFRVVNCQIVS